MKYKAVIFDLDGTVLNTLGDLTEGVNKALSHYSYPPRTQEEIRRFIGDGVHMLITRCLPEGVKDEETVTRVEQYFDRYYSKEGLVKYTMPYEGIESLLDAIKAAGVTICIASNKDDSAVKAIIPHFFGDRFYRQEGTRNFKERKPATVIVDRATEGLNFSKEELLFVGDTEVDMKTAAAYGIDFLAVSWGFRDFDRLVELGCEHIAKTPSEAKEIIFKMGV